MARNCVSALVGLAALAVVAGCGEAPAPEFRLDMVKVATNKLHHDYEQEIADVLAAIFGTPDDPQVLEETGLNQQLLTLAAGPAWTDPDDLTHGLYRRHCVHCHGITGDGRGPTARFLDPYPRDYRMGVFKFKSTEAAAKPTHEDLVRILHNGIPGTSMPSFSLLPRPEVDALVEYVKYLAIRGEMETELIGFISNELGEEDVEDENGEPIFNEDGTQKTIRLPLDPLKDSEQGEIIKEMLATIVEGWEAAAEQIVIPGEDDLPADDRTPEELAASIEAGRTLFFGTRANCFTCHGPTALGDGQQTDHDDWTKQILDLAKAREATTLELESLEETPEEESDEDYAERMRRIKEAEGQIETIDQVLAVQYPVRNAIPRNLRQGIYRGGRRRLDIFYRIHAGIKGVPMPGVGGTLTEAEIWQIVDYVLALPYEPASGPNQDRPLYEAAISR